jgi:hypothetical protein
MPVGTRPAAEAMLMMHPRLRCFIPGMTSAVIAVSAWQLSAIMDATKPGSTASSSSRKSEPG